MKRTLLLLPAIACLSLSVFAQVPVDKTVSLQSVEIQGKRFGGLTGGEVKRLQVDSNLSGLTGTTADVFRLLPSVVTDIEGGITFRGSNNPGLLINGVPYGLLEEYSGDMLIQLPALFFDRVSMTSTPSIGLVPDGDAGILNLSSAVYTAADSPLVLTLGAGFQERYNAGAILNLHPGKFHIVGKYNYRREFRKRTFSKSTTNKGGTTVMNNNASARPDVHLADLSVGYDLTANDLITVYGLYNLMDYSRYGKIHNNKLVDGNLQPVMFRHRYNDQRQEAYAAERVGTIPSTIRRIVWTSCSITIISGMTKITNTRTRSRKQARSLPRIITMSIRTRIIITCLSSTANSLPMTGICG